MVFKVTKEEMLKDEEKFMSEIGGKLVAHGFQRELKCIWPDMEDTNEQTWYNGIFKSIKNLFFTVEPRAPPSMADPSFLLGQPIKNEEDILHIRKLPDFDKSLSARNAELLLQYLTVPYLRIPLVLSFFSKPENTSALGNISLQEMLDAVLFEPGDFHQNTEKLCPEQIPSKTRLHMNTHLQQQLFQEHAVKARVAPQTLT